LNLLLGLTEPTDVVPRYLRELDEDLARIAEGSTSFNAAPKSSRLTIIRSMRLGGTSLVV